jgi:hypothetical protein
LNNGLEKELYWLCSDAEDVLYPKEEVREAVKGLSMRLCDASSTICDGLGLFTSRDIMKGELIGVVQGRENEPISAYAIEAFNGVDNKVDVDDVPTRRRDGSILGYMNEFICNEE